MGMTQGITSRPRSSCRPRNLRWSRSAQGMPKNSLMSSVPNVYLSVFFTERMKFGSCWTPVPLALSLTFAFASRRFLLRLLRVAAVAVVAEPERRIRGVGHHLAAVHLPVEVLEDGGGDVGRVAFVLRAPPAGRRGPPPPASLEPIALGGGHHLGVLLRRGERLRLLVLAVEEDEVVGDQIVVVDLGVVVHPHVVPLLGAGLRVGEAEPDAHRERIGDEGGEVEDGGEDRARSRRAPRAR